MPTPFFGADFFVESATQLGAKGIRVRFGHDPLAANPAGGSDGLNKSLYTITGPNPNVVTATAIVPDDPQSIDLTLAAPLSLGQYTVTVSGAMQTATARPLQAPRFASFNVTFIAPTDDVNGGANNDSAEGLIRKHLPTSLIGKAWNALIAALAVGDRLNWDNARLAFDQLFKSTASGLYLDRKASDDGLARPPDIGMPDDLFRRLAIKTSAAKITPEVLLEIMEVFYGSDSLRASSNTELSEPFTLAAGDSLELLMDGRDAASIFFQEGDFSRITQAAAEEVAAAITRGLRQNGNKGFAISYTDAATDTVRVRIYSGSLGLGSSVVVTGGRAQLGLHFPTALTSYNAAVSSADVYNWVVTSPVAGTNRIQLTNGGGSSKVDLSGVQPGDYVIFEPANSTIPHGVYPLTDVARFFNGTSLVQYFEIGGDTLAHSFLQLSNQEMTFYRPSRRTIHQAGSRTVVIAQTELNKLDIQIPATTQAVGRHVLSGAYLHDTNPLPVSSIQRLDDTVTVTTGGAHGLVVGQQVLVEDAYGDTNAPGITTGNPSVSGNPGTSNYSLASIWTQMRTQDTQGTNEHLAIKLADGRALICGGYFTSAGADIATTGCQLLRISATTSHPTGTQYTYNWDTSATLPLARDRHTGTLLTDPLNANKLLVTGGYNGSVILETTVLYTPNGGSGSWAATADMPNKRMKHAQVTLDSSKVLVIGGARNDVRALQECEIYDPTLDSWTVAAPMAQRRSDHRAIKLNNGKILVIGGRPLAQGWIDDSNVLAHWTMDEAGGTTVADTTGTYPLTTVNGPTVAVGKIDNCRDFTPANSHATGPGDAAATTAMLGEWTVSAWIKINSLTSLNGGITVTFVAHAAVGSGVNSVNNDTMTFQITNVVPNVPGTIVMRWQQAIGGNAIFTFTGSNTGLGVNDPVKNWVQGQWNHLVFIKKFNGVTYDGDLYVNGGYVGTVGGFNNSGTSTACTWWIGRSPDFTQTFPGLIDDVVVSKIKRTATEIAAMYRRGLGIVGIVPGLQTAQVGDLHASCEIYDPGGNTWSRTGSMAYGRIGHTATLLADGRVVVTGGTGYVWASSGASSQLLDLAEIYDPNTGCWLPLSRMNTARSGHGAVYLADRNKLLVAGGGAQKPEYLDLTTSQWRYVPNPPVNADALLSQSLVAVDSGPVALVGGFHTDASTAPCYLFQPGQDVFALGGLNGVFRIDAVPSDTSFTYSTPAYSGLTTNVSTTAVVKPLAAVDGGNIVGPFLFDPFGGAAVTAVETLATMDLFEGNQYRALEVADATAFPDEPGWLIVGFGTDTAVTPVKYLGRLSSTALILDYGFRFPATNLAAALTASNATRAANVTTVTLNLPANSTDHGIIVGQSVYFKSLVAGFGFGFKTVTARSPTTISFSDNGANSSQANPGSVVVTGPKVTLLKQKGLFVPDHPEQVGATYITASVAGRVAAINALDSSIAAGISTEITVLYPGDRGLGGEGLPAKGAQVLSDKVTIWGGDRQTEELEAAREDT